MTSSTQSSPTTGSLRNDILDAWLKTFEDGTPKGTTPIDKRTVYWKEGGRTVILRFLDQTGKLSAEIRNIGTTVSGRESHHQPTIVGKKINIITPMTYDRTETTKLSDLDNTSKDFTEIDIVHSPSSSSGSSSASISSSTSSSKSSYSSSSSGSSSSTTKAEEIARQRITKPSGISIGDKEKISSVISYKPFSITYMKGKKPETMIIQTDTDPNLSCLVYAKEGVAWFKFFDSNYYIHLQSGNTRVEWCKETMKLKVTAPNQTVTFVEPSKK